MPQKNALTTVYKKPLASAAELDAVARSQGYADYDDLIYSRENRLPPRYKPSGKAQKSSGGFVNVIRDLFNDPGKVLQSAFSWHPANTLGKASDALQQANNRSR